MNITLTIPDDKVARVINGMCGNFGYQPIINTLDENSIPVSTPNPETKADFAKRMMYKMIKDAVKSWEATTNAETARLAAIADVENNIILE